MIVRKLRESDPWLLLLHTFTWGAVAGYILGSAVSLTLPRIDVEGVLAIGLAIWGAIGGVLVGMFLAIARMIVR